MHAYVGAQYKREVLAAVQAKVVKRIQGGKKDWKEAGFAAQATGHWPRTVPEPPGGTARSHARSCPLLCPREKS
jgi:hypothetical protein